MQAGILERIAGIDYGAASAAAEGFIAGSVEKAGASGAILGVSGGVDSAVAAALACRALPGRVLAMIMPDSRVSPREETGRALALAGSLGVEHRLLDISQISYEYSKVLEPDRRAAGNLRARIRASILYYYASLRGMLVVGTGDRSEIQIGYFAKHGDGAADIMPLAPFYKTQVRGLARHLGLPGDIVAARSSPHLWEGHDAESEIGASYDQIDAVLHASETGAESGVDAGVEAAVLGMRRKSSHKRAMPPSLEWP